MPTRRILITAGPTHEPIDAVRYIGNRSSGQTGIALADEAAHRKWTVRLLLGQTPNAPSDSRVSVDRFRTTFDLEELLAVHFENCDVLIMAAAVADFRPVVSPEQMRGKVRRGTSSISIELHPTPDLVKGCSDRRTPGQLLVGFALETEGELDVSARSKLIRKGIDLVVANPLETMDAPTIRATVYEQSADGPKVTGSTKTPIAKEQFAAWLMDLIEQKNPVVSHE